jgi:hypothetical protein
MRHKEASVGTRHFDAADWSAAGHADQLSDVVHTSALMAGTREIAETLVLSELTVDVHVKHKLGFRSRAQVAGWFARQDPG